MLLENSTRGLHPFRSRTQITLHKAKTDTKGKTMLEREEEYDGVGFHRG